MPPRPARLARAPDVSPPAGTGLLLPAPALEWEACGLVQLGPIRSNWTISPLTPSQLPALVSYPLHRHSSGRRAGWPHMASPLQLDHILNWPGKKRESRAMGSHPSNAGFGPGAGLGGCELQ